MGFKISA